MNAAVEVAVVPCGHCCMCAPCAALLAQPMKCPMCRGAGEAMRIFLPEATAETVQLSRSMPMGVVWL